MNKNQANMAAILCFTLLCAGCATYTNSNPRFVSPPVGNYYKGGTPDFASRPNPDPQSRKIRIGNIWIVIALCNDFHNVEATTESGLSLIASSFMPLREQARNSPAFTNREKNAPDLLAAKREVCIPLYEYYVQLELKKKQSPYLMVTNSSGRVIVSPYKYTVANPSDFNFISGYPSQDWLGHLNGELATRYPSLFSANGEAFPVDMVIEMVYHGNGARRYESLYEAWILGLPQHGSLTEHDCVTKGAVFKAKEGFISPYDALAASLFKLSMWEWKELLPSNPNDFAWLKNDIPKSELSDRVIEAVRREENILKKIAIRGLREALLSRGNQNLNKDGDNDDAKQ